MGYDFFFGSFFVKPPGGKSQVWKFCGNMGYGFFSSNVFLSNQMRKNVKYRNSGAIWAMIFFFGSFSVKPNEEKSQV